MAQDTFFSSKKTLNVGGKIMSLDTPTVMGILNITPDSFYDSSRVFDENKWLKKADKMILDGASILDIGGYSSRPGASKISIKEELSRVLPAISSIKKKHPNIPISIDTFRHEIAQKAVDHGADMINDISAGELDPKMFGLVAKLKIPYIMMHMRGDPQTMQSFTQYDNLTLEVIDFFEPKVRQLTSQGVSDIIIDPGFGFAKDILQNFQLLRELGELRVFELPILAGLSRKSMIYKPLEINANQAMNGTTALNMIALMNGASILRVHDVKEAVETIKLYNLTYIK